MVFSADLACEKPNWPPSYAFNMTMLESGQSAERSSFPPCCAGDSGFDWQTYVNRQASHMQEHPPVHGTANRRNGHLETVLAMCLGHAATAGTDHTCSDSMPGLRLSRG